MRLRMGYIQEKRIVPVSFDELNTSLGNLCRQRSLIGQGVNDGFIFVERQRAKIKYRTLFRVQGPHIIGVGDSKILIETLVVGHKIRMIPQVPFPENGGS